MRSRLYRLRRLVSTVRHLRPGQIGWRLWFRVYRPRPDRRPAPARRTPARAPTPRPGGPARMTGPGQFTFLNAPGDLAAGWDPPDASKLWRYHLHYFDDLNAEDADARRTWHLDAIQRWLDANPPAAGTGWEPYPTSLRIVNWVLFDLRTGALPARARDSLAVQARWLTRRLERHLLGNHLLANAKALMAAGLYFDGAEARAWYARADRLLRQQVAEQVLPDGGHFERSPMYHLVVLQDLLDLIDLHGVVDRPAPAYLADAVPGMLDWSAVMRHPDGEIPFFNDATFGVAPPPGDLDAYAERLGFTPAPAPGEGARHLAASGFARLSRQGIVVLADVGSVGPSYLPGHAHAETLALEASVDGVRVLVDSGVSTYAPGPVRAAERATSAHNTLVLDGTNSSEVWGGFRVGRRARAGIEPVVPHAAEVMAWHDGYRARSGGPVHRRRVRASPGVLEVVDRVEGTGDHTAVVYWHLHPDVSVRAPAHQSADDRLLLRDRRTGLVIAVEVDGTAASEVADGTWRPGFGQALANRFIRLRAPGPLPLEITTRFEAIGSAETA